MLVYICESWVSLNHRSYCTVAEVNKGILSDCKGSLGAMKRKFIGLWECGIFGLPVRCTGRCQEQCVCKSEIRHGPWQLRAVFTVPLSHACLFFCEQSQCQASRCIARQGLLTVYVACPSLGVSPVPFLCLC